MVNYNLIPGKKIKKTLKVNNKEKVEISIITPFYNGGKTLEETANSVFSQTYPFFEWIIVDDGSKDKDSLKKLDEVAKKDQRIKVYHKENGGPSVARDFGINKASKESKYIFFLDCDDMMENNMLECLYWTLETHPDASFAYTAMTNFGDREFIWDQYLTVDREKNENIICISSMVKKDDLLEVGCFGIKEKAMYEDWNLWLKLLAAGKKPIRINEPLFWYRINNTGEFTRAKENHQRAMKIINETAKTINKEPEIIQFPRISKGIYQEQITSKMSLPQYERDNKKNILFLLPWMTIGGADVFNLELIKRLNKNKYNTIVLTTLPNENALRQEFYENTSETYNLSSFLERKDYLNFVDYIIMSRNIDIIFVSNSTYSYAMLPFIRSKYPNIAIVDYIHSVDFKDPRGGFGRYTKDFDSFIDKTFTCNNFTTNQLLNIFNKKQAETIYIGTDHERFNRDKIDKEKLKEKYNIPQDKKVITFIARLSEEKRPELFVEIAKKLSIDSSLHFVIAGGGPLYKKVKNKIKEYKLTKQITMLGWVDSNYSEEIYGISDITVNCSSLEGLALTSYESLSMGVPVVSSDVGGQKELINSTVGRIVEYGGEASENEADKYVKAINEVLENLKELKENSRKAILNGFTLAEMTKKFEEVFDKIKPNLLDSDYNSAIATYNVYLDLLCVEYDWFCSNFNSKYGIYNQSTETKNTFKSKIKNKVKRIANKYGIKGEVNTVADFFRNIINILKDVKYLILHIFALIKNFIKSGIATFKIIFKLIKRK